MDNNDGIMEIKNNLAILGMVLISLSMASAFGVATPYWDDHPLRLAPGESMDVELILQNMAGTAGDATLRAEMTDNAKGIAFLIDSNLDYFVPFGSDDIVMKVRVSVPVDVVSGGIRNVVISFIQVGNEDSGMVTVSGGFTTKFPVFVVAPEESVLFVPEPAVEVEVPQKSYVWVWVVLILTVLTVAWFVWKKSKK